MGLYRDAIFPFLLKHDAEKVHERIAAVGRGLMAVPGGVAALGALAPTPPERLHQSLFGREFHHPIGLAAGFDKNADAYPFYTALGMSFAELGSVTLNPQPGNPRPRIFREAATGDIYNSSGFPGVGSQQFLRNRRKNKRPVPLGLSLGKMKASSPEQALDEYRTMALEMGEWFDYIVVNLSSPNTPGLRDFQSQDVVGSFIGRVAAIRDALNQQSPVRPAWFIKISPNLDDATLKHIVDACLEHQLDGLVATNTLPQTDKSFPTKNGPVTLPSCGLSGRSIRERSTEVVGKIASHSAGRLTIIGVGGVFTAEDAYEKIRAGASLVQVYTGFVYGGPMTMKRMVDGLDRLLERDGFASVRDAIGVDARSN